MVRSNKKGGVTLQRAIRCLILLAAAISCCVVFCANVSAEERFKGMWVSTVYNLDYPSKPTDDPSVLKAEADKILDNCRDMGINNVFLQVRPNSDALYKSSIYPWSAYLTGEQGKAPADGFDPLEYWVEGAHARGMKLHAWINPYRATKVYSTSEDGLASLAPTNPAVLHPGYIIKYTDGNYYYNPYLPEVRQLVVDGIKEITDGYDVDGIHMDDYFYPGSDFADEAYFQKYKGSFTDKGDWRRNNVNLLVSEIKKTIDACGRDIEFGISPAGIWANKGNNPLGSNTSGNESYYAHYADTRKWALEGTVDYIAPQIYWEIGHARADYKTLVNWWADTLKDAPAKLYIGLADYRANGAAASDVWYGGSEIIRQLDLNGSIPKVSGEIHFRYKIIMDTPVLADKLKQYYTGGTQTTAAQTAAAAEQSTVITEQTVETTTQAPVMPAPKPAPAAAPDAVRVMVNGEYVVFDAPPVIEKGRTLVPMRAVFEALGADVQWNSDVQSVVAQRGETRITLLIGSEDMLVNNKDIVKLDVPAKIMESRTMIPLRAVSEAFDCKVDWDNEKRLVTITE